MSLTGTEAETGGDVTSLTRYLVLIIGAVIVFAIGFASGAYYMAPEPGVYQLTRVDCSDYESSVDCIAAQPSMVLTAEPSAERCASNTQLVQLMRQCRASAIDGYGQEDACNDGVTWIPQNMDLLEPQLQMMQNLTDQSCTLLDHKKAKQP
ncbi:MAG: hypothetical protein AAFW60_03295 [Pseudomonadota bacterium]